MPITLLTAFALALSVLLRPAAAAQVISPNAAFEDQVKGVWREIKVSPNLDEFGLPKWEVVERKNPQSVGPQHGTFKLRVLSYNIHGLAEIFVGKKEFPEARFAEIGNILRALRAAGAAPHIVGLQEAFVAKTDDIARLSGYPYVSRGPGKKGIALNSGLVILSEYPIKDADSIVFGKDCAGMDCWANKGVQYARVMVPGIPEGISIFNTHLNSDPEPKWVDERDRTDRAHMIQTWDLQDFMSEKGVLGKPSILISDFNDGPQDLDYNLFVGWIGMGGMRDTNRACVQTQACVKDLDMEDDWRNSADHQFYVGGANPKVQLDPIVYKKTFKAQVNGHSLSDHSGLEIHYLARW